MEQLEVNAVGPMLVANKFHCLLKRASELRGSAQVVNISSATGSLQLAMENDDCDAIYSISKAALNMLTCKLALEWKSVCIRATAFTPGWVQTDMGGPDAELTIEQSTVPLTKRILALTEEHNASLYRITGEKIPW